MEVRSGILTWRIAGAWLLTTCCSVAALSAALFAAQDSQSRATNSSKPPTVLFLCPHGAAKSILASAYFRQLAAERGLKVHVITARTEPDAEVAPVVAEHLKKNGVPVPITKPRRVTDDDLKVADVVVSIGCDLKGLPTPRGSLQRWDDVPGPSEDFAGAEKRIRERVIQLLDEMLRK